MILSQIVFLAHYDTMRYDVSGQDKKSFNHPELDRCTKVSSSLDVILIGIVWRNEEHTNAQQAQIPMLQSLKLWPMFNTHKYNLLSIHQRLQQIVNIAWYYHVRLWISCFILATKWGREIVSGQLCPVMISVSAVASGDVAARRLAF